jgi:hypothetical protein
MDFEVREERMVVAWSLRWALRLATVVVRTGGFVEGGMFTLGLEGRDFVVELSADRVFGGGGVWV